jgi:hypothetical protein
MKGWRGRFLILAVFCLCSAAGATEHGGAIWPVGAESYATAAAVPKPHKWMLYEYTCFYSANELDDAKGQPNGIPDFKLRVLAVAGKLAYNWGIKTPLGEVGSWAAVPVLYQQLHIPDGKYSRFDVSNVNIVPVALYNHKGIAYWYYELQFESLAAGYDATKPLNIGQHNYAFTPSFAFTLAPHKGSQNIMSRFDYTFNNPDHATHYHSGNEFFWQYGAQQEIPGHRMSVGLTGYFYKQTTNDTLHGVPVVTTNADGTECVGYKGRTLALGPQVTFPLGKHGALVVKWDHDMLVQNKPRGNAFWFQFGVPLSFKKE